MAFAFIQSKGGGSVGSTVLAYNSALTSGSLLVAAAYWNDAANSATVSDSVNGAWTAAAGGPLTGAGALTAWRFGIFYFIGNAATTAATVTLTSSGGTNCALAIHEYTGTTPTVDGTPIFANYTGTTTVTSGAVVTTVDGDLLFCGGVTSFAAGAAGAGFVKREGTNFGDNLTEDDLDGGAAGSKTATFAQSAFSDDTIVGLIAFKEAVAAGQILRPDADTTTTGWTTTPLWSKLDEDPAGGDVVTATAS